MAFTFPGDSTMTRPLGNLSSSAVAFFEASTNGRESTSWWTAAASSQRSAPRVRIQEASTGFTFDGFAGKPLPAGVSKGSRRPPARLRTGLERFRKMTTQILAGSAFEQPPASVSQGGREPGSGTKDAVGSPGDSLPSWGLARRRLRRPRGRRPQLLRARASPAALWGARDARRRNALQVRGHTVC
jgi:hypothetical protein